MPRRNTAVDFWQSVIKSGLNDCWAWAKAKDQDGYGLFWFKNKQMRATRFIVGIILKKSIEGKVVCHRCDNPGCVNPKHLFIGTHADNSRDRDAKGRGVRGERVHTARLKERQVISIKKMLREKKLSHSKIASRFGVTKSTVTFIANRRSWKHVG